MSTTSEIERMPASFSRADIQAGVGRLGSMPRTTRVTNTDVPTCPRIGAASSRRTGNAVVAATAGTARAGSRNAAPVELEYSRATPRMDSA